MGDEDSEDSEHEMVANPQKEWLQKAKQTVDPAATTLRSCLSDGELALIGGAWEGAKGDAWGQEFNGRLTTLRSKVEHVQTDLDQTIGSMPDQVCKCRVAFNGFGSNGSYGSYFDLATPYPSLLPSCSG